ncbi:HTH-type transcriptional activator RhaS (plasmid) [Roseobacter fucihabitans]|uniref:HTH-type transcriptional activator RhaS n=1 Tax=Roseobacter fucihabitans TaxID=1537242 RepID=A0ABZ2C1N6_9RHOB|nr:helix-turn-helix transcriptional regulator [Roseobacter litoralis]MBC6965977.1 CFA/I fimbrial subunit D [Roseobacter litoralis]
MTNPTQTKAQIKYLEVQQSSSATFRQLHTSHFLLLRICSGEKVIIDEAGEKTRVRSGEFAYLRRGERLTVSNLVDDEGLYRAEGFVINEAAMLNCRKDAQVDDLSCKSRAGAMHEEFSYAFSRLVGVLTNGTVSDRILLHRFKELTIWMQEAGVALEPTSPSAVTARLRDLLEADLERAWRSEDAAQALGLSESTLRRKLSKENTRFSQELRDARLSKALMLIQTTDRSLSEIAFASGFSSQSRFNEAFKARFAVSPRNLLVRSGKLSA